MESRKRTVAGLERKAALIRRDIWRMIFLSQSGHPGGSFSAADIVTALYFHFLRVDPKNPGWPLRDRFILSKGHACPLWYACLAELGFFPLEHLACLREIDGILQGHPDMRKTPGLDMSTGSLGQGLSIGVGMALGLRAAGLEEPRVHVVLGDGECDEGQVWEAAMAAAKFRLGNLIAFIDFNDLQLDGHCHDVMPLEPLADKWRAFNWRVLEIDGNDMGQVCDAVSSARENGSGGPWAIVARTVKGRGVSFMENRCEWHGKAPDRDEYERGLRELGGDPDADPRFSRPSGPGRWRTAQRLLFAGAREVPTRDAYGEALVELGRERADVVVLEADISKSTRTQEFSRLFPDRFYQCGIAEADTVGIAAGLATTGRIPFVSTYSVFASMRACEQIRTSVAYPRLPVKLAVSHGGLTPGNDGVTHQGTEDLGVVRTIPGMTVVVPADAAATKALVREAASYPGPVYLRFTRDPVPVLYGPEEEFRIGRGKVLREGGDVLLVAIGDMVWVALEAWERLRREGVAACVVDMHTLKPIDADLLGAKAANAGCAVTVEDHQVQCGLGGAVAEVLGDRCPVPLARVGLADTFAESGTYDFLLQKYRMDPMTVAAAARDVIGRKEGRPHGNPR